MSALTRPRWTHIALPSVDLDRSIAWYEEYTPLVLLERFQDDVGQSAWLSHEHQVENPFVLVLVMFYKDQGRPQPQLAPFAHIGVEVPTREELDAIADKARAAGCLAMEPVDLPPPVGYVCMIADPDGNRIEISHDQAVYDTVQAKWGSTS